MKKFKMPGFLALGRFAAHPKIMKAIFELSGFLIKLINKIPIIRRNNPWMKPEYSNMYWIPVNKSLGQVENIPLPHEIVSHFIETSSHRVVIDFCGCRKACTCQNYPVEIGCLLMGEDARGINSPLARSVSKEEAHEHLQKAVDAGLAPFVGKARIDNAIFGVPDTGRMVSVCFCCECCCLTRWTESLTVKERGQIMHKLDGLKIWIDEDRCIGCRLCLDKCFIGLIEIDNGNKARIPEDECQGCGRCVISCPQEAIRVSMDNKDYVNHAIGSIEAYVKAGK